MLNEVTVRNAKPGIHWDGGLKGFGLRVGKNRRTFIVLVASGHRHSIGVWPHMSLADARKEARRILAEKALGRTAPQRVPFDTAVTDFLKDCEKRLRPGTVRLYRHHLTRHFPFGRQALADVEPRQIVRALKDLPPSQHEHAVRIGKTFFKWAIREHLIDSSPMERMSAPMGKARDRVLSEDELRAVWKAARALRTPFHGIVAMLVLTGQRRGEISRLEWSWIDGDTVTLPSSLTKNGRTHRFPIGPEARAVLDALPRLSDRYVFPALRQSGENTSTFSGWGKPKARFDEECGVAGWTLHDLRRTYATVMQQLGVRLEVTEALLNHVSGSSSGVVGVYHRHRWEAEKREAQEKYEAALARL